VRREGRGRRGSKARAGGLKLEVKVYKVEVEVQHSVLHIWPGKNEREWKETKGQNGKTRRLLQHLWAHFPSLLE